MKKLLKPASFAFYFLMLLVFFIVGIYVAKLIGAGKNQMLAGGAIVLGWGVMFAGGALLVSFFIVRYVSHKIIVRLNWILLVAIGILYGITHYQYLQREKQKEEDAKKENFDPTPNVVTEPTALLVKKIAAEKDTYEKPLIQDKEMGMGFFSPNHYENPTLYFYGNPNLEKSIVEHMPVDSITFKRNQYGQFEIATAPPWLVPDILKLDYDILYFRIKSITQEFVEVTVNTTNGQTSYVNRSDGKVAFWGDFLMRMNSVEFYPNSNEKVRDRPFSSSGVSNTPYEFMRAVRIQNDWMQVLLLDGDFKTVGKGWIQWKRDNKLLILYNLLS